MVVLGGGAVSYERGTPVVKGLNASWGQWSESDIRDRSTGVPRS